MIDYTELKKYLDDKPLSKVEKALAYFQAEQLEFKLGFEYFYNKPYDDYISQQDLKLGDKISKVPPKYKGITMFPYEVKKAEDGEEILGVVILVLEKTKYEYRGLYMQEGAD